MAGTKLGGLKASRKNKERFGEDFYVKLGTKGGTAYHSLRGFQLMPRAKIQAAGSKGGKKSKKWSPERRAAHSAAMKKAWWRRLWLS